MKNSFLYKLKMASLYTFSGLILQALLVSILLASSPIEAQNLRDIKISINAANITLERTFEIIEQKTNFKFNYVRSELPMDDKTTVNYDHESLYNILKSLAMEFHLTFSRINEQIVVKKTTGSDKEELIRETGKIHGKIADAVTGEPLIGAIVKLNSLNIGAISDIEGNYIITNIPLGNYKLSFSYIGYEIKEIDNIQISDNSDKQLDVQLREKSIHLKEVTITPGLFSIMGNTMITQQTLTKDEISKITFLEDIYRSIKRLPGITSNDYSAKFNVRGGESNEILVNLDGLQLYEPFHMKDYMGGLLSVIDLNTVGGINLFAGGFPAEYGNKMSGVFDVKTQTVKDDEKTLSAGISMMNARLTSKGTFMDNKGSWLLSARRGYLDLVLGIVSEEEVYPSPVYYDILGKVTYRLFENHSLALNFLIAGDKMNYTEDDDDYSETGYGNSYAWIALNSVFNPKLVTQTILAVGETTQRKQGIGYFGNSKDSENDIEFDVKDNRTFSMARIKQDWSFDLSEDIFFKWGFNLNFGKSSYDYSYIWNRYVTNSNNQWILVHDMSGINVKPSGNQYGLYISDKMRLFKSLAFELGIRYDYVSYIKKGFFSPRINIAYAFNNRTALRAGWGYFYQPEELNEVNIPNGETDFYNSELSKHWLIGFEHYFNNGLHFRLEAYYKDISNLHPKYRDFLNLESLEIFPQFIGNTIKISFENTIAKGIETYLKYDDGERFSVWFSYIFSYKDEKISSIIFDDGVKSNYNRYFPGSNDQRHTINLDLSYRIDSDWDINLAWQYHSGWPYNDIYHFTATDKNGKTINYITPNEYYSLRLPYYSRVDLRVSKYFNTSFGKITLFGEIINLLNRKNIRAFEYTSFINTSNQFIFSKESFGWLPLLPSIGVNWELN